VSPTVYSHENCAVKGCQNAAVLGTKYCGIHGTFLSRLCRYPRSMLVSIVSNISNKIDTVQYHLRERRRRAELNVWRTKHDREMRKSRVNVEQQLVSESDRPRVAPKPTDHPREGLVGGPLRPSPVPASELADLPGQIRSRYEVSHLLGVGGFGRVYLARDRSLGRTVAIKILEDSLVLEGEILERFQNDARVLAQLNHANLIAVYDLIAGRYIVMEYINGGTVRDLLVANRSIDLLRAVQITSAVLSALQLAHENGIIHRDIKPENVLLTRSGTPKLCDFGVAHVPKTSVKTTYAHPGTVAYMSPEQVRGMKLDGRSDIYSAGALFYELLAGDIYIDPANRGTPYAMASAVLNQDPKPLGSLLSSCAKSVDAIVKQMMEKDRGRRYSSADRARSALMSLGR